jgi:chromosome segregation ATPase
MGVIPAKLYIAAGVILAAFAAGWLINGWRLAGKVEKLQGTLTIQQQAVAERDAALKARDTTIDSLRGEIDSTNTVVSGLEEKGRQEAAAREAERKAWGTERQRLQAERDAALAHPWPKDCEGVLRDIVRRAP